MKVEGLKVESSTFNLQSLVSPWSYAHVMFLQIFEHYEQRRYHEEQGYSAQQHSSHRANTYRYVSVGTHSACEHQRKHTEHHGQRGHEYGAQTCLGGCHGCSTYRHALAAACRCVLGKQYGGLGEQSDEHDEPRLHVYVVFKSPQLCEDEAAHQSEGHAQDDGKRYHEALVEGAQDEVYEDYADDEHHGGGIACRGFLTRHASELVAVAFGQCLVGCLTHGVNCLPRTVAIGWRTIDSYG